MIACLAEAQSDALRIDRDELEDARWFDRGEVEAALDGGPGAAFQAPPHFAIAHTLLAYWARRS
jgi:NAD+ diphosphatase